MWRHAANAYLTVKGVASDFLIMGPLRGGGILVELGWTLNVAATGQVRFAAAISGVQSPTIGNLRGSTSLIQRSNDRSVIFGVPTIRLQVARDKHERIVLPLSVNLNTGGQFIIMGIWSGTEDLDLNVVAWALEIGGPGGAGYKGQTGKA